VCVVVLQNQGTLTRLQKLEANALAENALAADRQSLAKALETLSMSEYNLAARYLLSSQVDLPKSASQTSDPEARPSSSGGQSQPKGQSQPSGKSQPSGQSQPSQFARVSDLHVSQSGMVLLDTREFHKVYIEPADDSPVSVVVSETGLIRKVETAPNQ
jgi:hypothetical protein